jgi:hypothetical protein
VYRKMGFEIGFVMSSRRLCFIGKLKKNREREIWRVRWRWRCCFQFVKFCVANYVRYDEDELLKLIWVSYF